jgi:putative flippase GtrA
MGSALAPVVTQSSKRLMKVGVSGVVATAIDVVTLILLVEGVGAHVTVAAFLAAIAGGIANFFVNKYWAFKDPTPIDLRQVASYALVSLVTAMFVAASIHVFAVLIGLPYLLAKGMAAVLVFLLWSYPAQSRLVFRPGAQPASAGFAAEVFGDDEAYDDDFAGVAGESSSSLGLR